MSAIPRNEGESQEDYKARRAADHEATKLKSYGQLVHSAYYDGTYVRATPKKLSKKALKKQQLKGGK